MYGVWMETDWNQWVFGVGWIFLEKDYLQYSPAFVVSFGPFSLILGQKNF